MKILSAQEMKSVDGGGVILDTLGSIVNRINSATANAKKNKPPVDPFVDNMQKMFGATAGKDLAKIVQSIGLVDVVNSIFGW